MHIDLVNYGTLLCRDTLRIYKQHIKIASMDWHELVRLLATNRPLVENLYGHYGVRNIITWMAC